MTFRAIRKTSVLAAVGPCPDTARSHPTDRSRCISPLPRWGTLQTAPRSQFPRARASPDGRLATQQPMPTAVVPFVIRKFSRVTIEPSLKEIPLMIEQTEVASPPKSPKPVSQLEDATVRFCGDSGDGMQLAGTQLTNTSALAGNDVATFPDFPAEIRAPRGTKAGCERLSDPFRQPRDLHPRRPGSSAGGDESGGTGDEPVRPGQGRNPDRRQGCVRRQGSEDGRLRRPTRSKTTAWRATGCFRSR